MSPHENQAIAALTEALRENTEEMRGYRKDVALLHTKVFGDEKGENAKGRLPMLEAGQQNLGTRVSKLEKLRMHAQGAGWVLALIFGGVELLYHLVGIQRH